MSLYSIRTIKLASDRRLCLFISSLLCGLCLSSQNETVSFGRELYKTCCGLHSTFSNSSSSARSTNSAMVGTSPEHKVYSCFVCLFVYLFVCLFLLSCLLSVVFTVLIQPYGYTSINLLKSVHFNQATSKDSFYALTVSSRGTAPPGTCSVRQPGYDDCSVHHVE